MAITQTVPTTHFVVERGFGSGGPGLAPSPHFRDDSHTRPGLLRRLRDATDRGDFETVAELAQKLAALTPTAQTN